MLDIAAALHGWCAQRRDFAVATVVAVHGSAPRLPGAALAVAADGEAVGSVSGGCVEGAVYELCRQALDDGHSIVERFGYSEDDAFAIGLTCGGAIDVLIAPVRWGSALDRSAPGRVRVLAAAVAAAADGCPTALARVVAGPPELVGGALLVRPGRPVTGSFGGPATLDRTVAREAAALLAAGRTTTRTVGAAGTGCGAPVTVLVESSLPAPRMLVFGAVDFAAALVRAGRFLGYRVTVCDARPVFATARRFPEADEVVVDWPHRYLDRQLAVPGTAERDRPADPGRNGGQHNGPDDGCHEPDGRSANGRQQQDGGSDNGRGSAWARGIDGRTALCVLTHDAKFDVPLLVRALRLPVGYVGAMGSRRTHLTRLHRLREAGLTARELSRLHSPIGLDLGARTPEETALSIAAEIVAARRGGSGTPLTGAHTPIHRDLALPPT